MLCPKYARFRKVLEMGPFSVGKLLYYRRERLYSWDTSWGWLGESRKVDKAFPIISLPDGASLSPGSHKSPTMGRPQEPPPLRDPWFCLTPIGGYTNEQECGGY